MKMKKLHIIAALLGSAIAISSCKKDISLTPTNGAPVSSYFTNQKDMTAALAGIYSGFQEEMTGAGQAADEGYGGRYHYWGEARSDNFTSSTFSTGSTVEMATNGLTFTNVASDWGGLYKVIARCNLAIKYFPQIASTDPNVTPQITNNAMAQALAMRAESYFYVVRVWKNAPIWTEPYLDINTPGSKPQESGTKIIDSVIIPDLTKAYTIIQKGQTPVVWNVGEAAICAIMGDVYMWRAGLAGVGTAADYTNALVWYNRIFLAKGPTGSQYTNSGTLLETTANWKNLFLTPSNESEDIWSIYWDYNANGCACIPISIQLSNNPLMLDANFQAQYKKGYKTDTRVAKTIDTLATLNHQNLIYKFLNLNPTAAGITPVASNTNYNVYLTMNRLGDVYLSMAEAYAFTGDLANAVKFYNYVYIRARQINATPAIAGITTTTYPNAVALEDAILTERQYELLGEGKRWFDLVRTNRVEAVMGPILNVRNGTKVTQPNGTVVITPLTTGFGDVNRFYWPISQSALNNNKLLNQNAGY